LSYKFEPHLPRQKDENYLQQITISQSQIGTGQISKHLQPIPTVLMSKYNNFYLNFKIYEMRFKFCVYRNNLLQHVQVRLGNGRE
jgi:hypothetical protein